MTAAVNDVDRVLTFEDGFRSGETVRIDTYDGNTWTATGLGAEYRTNFYYPSGTHVVIVEVMQRRPAYFLSIREGDTHYCHALIAGKLRLLTVTRCNYREHCTITRVSSPGDR